MQFPELVTQLSCADDSSLRLLLVAALVLRAQLTPTQPDGPLPAP